jgi:hypothetical protein
MDLAEATAKILEAANASEAAAKEATNAAREATTAAHGAQAAANATAGAIHALQRHHALLRRDVTELWRRTLGEEPPAPPPGWAPPLSADVAEIIGPLTAFSQPPLATKVKDARASASDVGNELAEFQGAVVAEFSAVRAELAAQSDVMGVGKRGWDFLLSRAGQKSIWRNLTLVAAIVGAVGAMVAACRAPAPAPPLPAPSAVSR